MDEERERFSVVIADDSEDIRMLIQMVLERDGRFDVIDVVSDGVTAVSVLSRHRPDLATFDLHMEGMADLDSLRQARSASPATALVVVTGTYRAGHDPDLDTAEVDDWLHKDQIMTVLPERLIAAWRAKGRPSSGS